MGDSVWYVCETDGQVTDYGKYHDNECDSSGTWSKGEDAGSVECRDPGFECGIPPDPPESTNLEKNTTDTLQG